jgi:alternate signal-mediated exported protein
MKKTSKGVLAGAVGVLLLGGAVSTHATWTDDGVISGTTIGAGHLKLVNAQCNGWLINGNLFDPATIKLVPGSVLTQVCTFEVSALGADIKANLSVTAPQFQSANGLTAALQTSATYRDASTNAPIDASTALVDGEVVKAALQVTLPSLVGNAVQGLTATLQSITVTATQV